MNGDNFSGTYEKFLNYSFEILKMLRKQNNRYRTDSSRQRMRHVVLCEPE